MVRGSLAAMIGAFKRVPLAARRAGLILTVVLAASATCAQASPIQVDLLITYFPATVPPDPIFQDTLLSGAASFWIGQGTRIDPYLLQGPPIDIGRLAVGGAFITSFQLDDPCLGACQWGFRFSGLAGQFSAFGFLDEDEVPVIATGPPIVPLVRYLITGPPIRQSGQIVAYDAPIRVGTWDVTTSSPTTVPEPGTCVLLGTGLLVLGRRIRSAHRRQP